MKNLFKFILIFAFVNSFANVKNNDEYDFTKDKKVSKTFNTNKDVITNISNSYGFINVYLWNEDKVSIEVNIKVSGNNEKKVIDRLEDIQILFENSNSEVFAKTKMENSYGNNMSLEINYTVKIPKNGNVNLKNNYGNIAMEELFGTANVVCNYGSVTFGNLRNSTNTLNLTYSKNSKIDYVNQLDLDAQYSTIEIQKSNLTRLDGNYNKYVISNTGSIFMEGNYTNLKTKNIQKAKIDGNYLTLNDLDVKKSIDIKTNYTNIDINLYESIENININANYTHSKIYANKNSNFTFDIKLGYGSIKDEIGLKYVEKFEKNYSKTYNGYYNSKSNNNVTINTNYGSVQFLNQ